jgi:hypothetical protein
MPKDKIVVGQDLMAGFQAAVADWRGHTSSALEMFEHISGAGHLAVLGIAKGSLSVNPSPDELAGKFEEKKKTIQDAIDTLNQRLVDRNSYVAQIRVRKKTEQQCIDGIKKTFVLVEKDIEDWKKTWDAPDSLDKIFKKYIDKMNEYQKSG